MPRILLYLAVASIASPAASGLSGCNRSRKESSEKQLKASVPETGPADAQAMKAKGIKPKVEGQAQAAAEETEPGDGDGLKLEEAEDKDYSPELPDLSGLEGMDPDSLPDGDEGLDAAVALWTTVGEEAKLKVEAQDSAQAGKEPVDPKDLAKGLPKAVEGWKAKGKTAMSHQKHRGFLLPMASKVFTQPDGVMANVTIMDTLSTAEIRVGFEMGLAITKKAKSPRQKAVTVGGADGYILVRQAKPDSGKPATSKGALLVKDRFLVVVNADNLADFDAILAILSSIEIKKLEALDA